MKNEKNDYCVLLDRLERLEQLTALSAKTILTIDDVSALTGLSKQRIYTLCSQREIPHYKQGKLYFKRKELEDWQTANRISTYAEINSKAQMYCYTH